MGPEGAGRRASSRSNRGRSAPSRGRRRRGATRRRLVRSAAILSVVAAAVIFASGQLGTWDALLQPQQIANRQPLATAPAAGGGAAAGGETAGGPVVWSTGRDLEERGEGVRREGRPIPPIELTGYQWPLPSAILLDEYGPSTDGSFNVDGARFNDGVDLATTCGDPIVAAHSGVVIAAGRRYGEASGWLGDLEAYYDRLDRERAWKEAAIGVVIDDGNGYRSIYAHFKDIVVTVGQRVQAGELLGSEGKTGGASSCRLHYAIFSPHETASMKLIRRIAERSLLPNRAIARIDPLAVLPSLAVGEVSRVD